VYDIDGKLLNTLTANNPKQAAERAAIVDNSDENEDYIVRESGSKLGCVYSVSPEPQKASRTKDMVRFLTSGRKKGDVAKISRENKIKVSPQKVHTSGARCPCATKHSSKKSKLSKAKSTPKNKKSRTTPKKSKK
jgi:hypothetical protein